MYVHGWDRIGWDGMGIHPSLPISIYLDMCVCVCVHVCMYVCLLNAWVGGFTCACARMQEWVRRVIFLLSGVGTTHIRTLEDFKQVEMSEHR